MRKQLRILQEKISRLETPWRWRGVRLGHRDADAALEKGLLAGALHEVFAAERHAPAGTGFALMITLRLAAEKNLLWVQHEFSSSICGELSPSGFLELGFEPERLTLVRAANPMHALRAAADALSCRALGAVVLESWSDTGNFDLAASRKLTLAAAQSGVALIHLRIAGTPRTSTAETRWLIESAATKGDFGHPVLSVALSRNRHGRTGHFSMEWSCDERIFREPANSRAVAAVIADRSREAQREFRRAG